MSVSSLPLISVVVAVKNGERTLARCLESLARQTYSNVEIIVVNDGSTDATGDIAVEFAAHGNVFLITTEGVGPSQARNLGIKQAQGAYIAFTDGDCICKPDWLSTLAGCIVSAPRVAGVGGDQQSPDDDTQYGKFINNFMKTIGFIADYVKGPDVLACIATNHNPTCNVLYRKAIFDEVGMFLPGLWPGEDVELDHRITAAGYRLLYTPQAVVLHYRTGSPSAFARMMFRYGFAQARLVRMYGFFRLIHVVPAVVCLALVTSVLMVCAGRVDALFAFCLASVIFAIIFFMVKAKDLVTALRYSLHLAVTVLWWNAGFAAGLVDGKKLSREQHN